MSPCTGHPTLLQILHERETRPEFYQGRAGSNVEPKATPEHVIQIRNGPTPERMHIVRNSSIPHILAVQVVVPRQEEDASPRNQPSCNIEWHKTCDKFSFVGG